MVWVRAAAVAVLGTALAQDFSDMNKYASRGCYSSIPSGFTSQGSSSSNSLLNCFSTCNKAGFTVMALQGEQCLCGNEIPAGSASGSCDTNCPGYPGDNCGGQNAYNVLVAKDASPSTAGSDDSSSSAPATSSSQPSSSAAASSSSAPASSSSSSSSSSPSSSSSSSSSSESASSSETQSNTQSTVTVSGSVLVSTVTASQSQTSTTSSSETHTSTQAPSSTGSASASTASDSASSSSEAKKSGGGLGGGAIAGIVVGVVVGILAIAALAFFIWRRRKGEEFYSPSGSPHKFETSFNSGYNQDYPSVVDQRLNPQLLNHRISIASLADARDYSRQILKVANPDDKE